MHRILLSIMLLMLFSTYTRAAKINAAYINTQPQPLGSLTLGTAQTYGQTQFTRFNIMGLTFCPNSQGSQCSNQAEQANPIHWGGGQPLNASWQVPAQMQPVLQSVQALNPNGDKQLFASIIGNQTNDYLAGLATTLITANSTTCGVGGSGVQNIHCAVFYLDRFFNAYGLHGLDVDLEGGDQQGFVNLMTAIGSNNTIKNKYLWSFAPFGDGNYASAVYVQGGGCVFQDNGLNYVAGRQYYSGGAIGSPPQKADELVNTVVSELAQAKQTTCSGSGALQLGAPQMVMGLAPYSVLGAQFPFTRGFPNTCQYYYQRGNPDCAEMMKLVLKQYPDIGGAFVWTSGLIDPTYYACYMGNALNGTQNDCGEPQPIPGNAGYCGPTQPPNCSNPDPMDIQAGPIWNNQEAQSVCPTTCGNVGLAWNGQWKTTQPGVMSVCGCVPKS